jgi:hypothetical protein
MPPRDLEAATMGGADHPTTRKKRTQTVAWAALLVFVALLQLLVYHMHSVRHHVGSFGRSARERERVVLPRGGDDDGDGWALVGGDGRGDGGRVGEGDDGVGTSKSKSNGGGGGGGAGFRRAGDVVGLDSRGDVDAGLIEEAGTRRAGGGTLHNADG